MRHTEVDAPILSYIDAHQGEHITTRQLAEAASTSKRTVFRAIARLATSGAILIDRELSNPWNGNSYMVAKK